MKERESNFDLLRVICAFAVILLHVACLWVFMDPGDASGALLETYQRNQFIARVYDIMTRFAVPCFVMLSGAFVLANKKNSDFKYFYKKTLKTLAIPTAIFAVLYVIYRLCRLYGWGMLTKSVFFETVGSIFTGQPYAHMWYMYMIIGVYLAMPIMMAVKEKVGERNFKRGGGNTIITFFAVFPK